MCRIYLLLRPSLTTTCTFIITALSTPNAASSSPSPPPTATISSSIPVTSLPMPHLLLPPSICQDVQANTANSTRLNMPSKLTGVFNDSTLAAALVRPDCRISMEVRTTHLHSPIHDSDAYYQVQ
ncbi:hypothetical protein GG344DRAFT_66585 [Lentinula edodes]|nr:hypothetical protein GG344DRAFT_66585 [Lentinula edodes]